MSKMRVLLWLATLALFVLWLALSTSAPLTVLICGAAWGALMFFWRDRREG